MVSSLYFTQRSNPPDKGLNVIGLKAYNLELLPTNGVILNQRKIECLLESSVVAICNKIERKNCAEMKGILNNVARKLCKVAAVI